MQPPVPTTTSFLFLLFLLIPGYIALRAFYFSVISIDDLSRLDKLATIVTGGFVSLIMVGGFYRLNLPSMASFLLDFGADAACRTASVPRGAVVHTFSIPIFQEILTPRCPIHPTQYTANQQIEVSTSNAPSLVASGLIISIQSVIGLLIGYSYGVYRRKLDDNPQSREELSQPWQRAYEVTDIGQTATIVTPEDRIVEGTIQQLGSPSKDYDILLANPMEVTQELGGEIINKRPIGNYSYHNYRDISRIEFGKHTDDDLYDPDSDTEGNRSFRQELKSRTTALRETIGTVLPEKSPQQPEATIKDGIDEDDVNIED